MSLAAGPGRGGPVQADINSTSSESASLHVARHVEYIEALDSRKDEYAYWLTEHLRLNGLYWGLNALCLMHHQDRLPRNEVLDFVLNCFHSKVGGFGAAPSHDPHMLYTVSAVQIITILDGWGELELKHPGGRDKVAKYIASLQDSSSGTFFGDEFGETDTRFLYGAFNALSLMGLLHLVDVDKAVAYIKSCANPDGGYGTTPGAETHAGQVFTCVAALAIAKRLDVLDIDKLCVWLSERQITDGAGRGGLNGRPEKQEDVCYSWWVLSPLAILGKLHWINGEALTQFILKCQDSRLGGFSDRPLNFVDVYHTHFALTGLSLLGYEGLVEVDPVYCLPKDVVERAVKSNR